jgi:putative ABC transport system permease protein
MDGEAETSVITPGYLETMGISILSGRDFDDRDRDGAPAVIMINRKMARRFWHDRDPVNQQIMIGKFPLTIIGVVEDVRYRSLAEEAENRVFVPYAQSYYRPVRDMTIVIRTSGDPLAIASLVRSVVRSIDATVPVSRVRAGQDLLDAILSRFRFRALSLGVLAGVAFFLTMIGIYCMVADTVNRQSHAIAVRVALGAQRTDLFRFILSRTAEVMSAGILGGIWITWLAQRSMSALLFEIRHDVLISLVTTILFGLGGLIAGYVPVHMMLARDPIRDLRYH